MCICVWMYKCLYAALKTQHNTLHKGLQLDMVSRIRGSKNTEDNPFSAPLTQFLVYRTSFLYYIEKASG